MQRIYTPKSSRASPIKIQYTVECGDTLSEITATYNLTTSELVGYQRGKRKVKDCDPGSMCVDGSCVVNSAPDSITPAHS